MYLFTPPLLGRHVHSVLSDKTPYEWSKGMPGHNKALPCSLMASLNDMRQAAGEFSASRTEEVSTQEVFTHRATVRLQGLSGCSSWRLGSVSTNQTSPWPTSLLWNRNRKADKERKEQDYSETGTQNDLERKEILHNKSLRRTNWMHIFVSVWESPEKSFDEITHSTSHTHCWLLVQHH